MVSPLYLYYHVITGLYIIFSSQFSVVVSVASGDIAGKACH